MNTNVNGARDASSVARSQSVLRASERPRPAVGIVSRFLARLGERIQDDEQRVTPRPGVVGVRGRAAGIERVAPHGRKVLLPHGGSPGCHVAGPTPGPAGLAIMIPEGQVDRHRAAGQTEVVALGHVLPRGVLVGGVFLGHERVAEIDQEVRPIGDDVRQRVDVDPRIAVAVEVRIRLKVERERIAGRTRRAERSRRQRSVGGDREAIRLVRRQPRDLDVLRHAGFQRERPWRTAGFVRESGGDVARRHDAQRHGRRRWPRLDDVQIVRRHVRQEHARRASRSALPALPPLGEGPRRQRGDGDCPHDDRAGHLGLRPPGGGQVTPQGGRRSRAPTVLPQLAMMTIEVARVA